MKDKTFLRARFWLLMITILNVAFIFFRINNINGENYSMITLITRLNDAEFWGAITNGEVKAMYSVSTVFAVLTTLLGFTYTMLKEKTTFFRVLIMTYSVSLAFHAFAMGVIINNISFKAGIYSYETVAFIISLVVIYIAARVNHKNIIKGDET